MQNEMNQSQIESDANLSGRTMSDEEISTRKAVGIDFGTTYSSISYLDAQGNPHLIPNEAGEFSIPSAIFFSEQGVTVGNKALKNVITHPDQVMLYPKKYIGEKGRHWSFFGKEYTAVSLSAIIIKQLLRNAEKQLGQIEHAVITVPAQFSEPQRQAVVVAGKMAGLKSIDLINEPVSAALCYVLGEEGLWFSELTRDQTILVFDLGGGTFDLSLVKYSQNSVRVLGGGGHLKLGGLDWSRCLEKLIVSRFSRLVKQDLRKNRQFRQSLMWDAEQLKCRLSHNLLDEIRCEHGKFKSTFKISQEEFERITQPLVEKTVHLTQKLLESHKMGWAHIDAVLLAGGATQMPMIRKRVKQISGRTLNTSLSPEKSIAQGAAYYSGMLLSNKKFAKSIFEKKAKKRLANMRQHSVTSRALGFMVRNGENTGRVPHYLIPQNTVLPTSVTQQFETVRRGQEMIKLPIVESPLTDESGPARIGDCVIDHLPPGLPEGSQILVTMHYDESARLEVSARELNSGNETRISIKREEKEIQQVHLHEEVVASRESAAKRSRVNTPKSPSGKGEFTHSSMLETLAAAEKFNAQEPILQMDSRVAPVALCEKCMEPFDHEGLCVKCRQPIISFNAPTPVPSAPPASNSSSKSKAGKRKRRTGKGPQQSRGPSRKK